MCVKVQGRTTRRRKSWWPKKS